MMATRLVQAGHEVHVVTAFRDPSAIRGVWQARADGIHIHWIPIRYSNHMGFRQRISAFAEFAVKSARVAASIRGDLVFATSTPLTIALPGIYASWRLGRPRYSRFGTCGRSFRWRLGSCGIPC